MREHILLDRVFRREVFSEEVTSWLELNKSCEDGDGMLGRGEHLRLTGPQVKSMEDEPEDWEENKFTGLKTREEESGLNKKQEELSSERWAEPTPSRSLSWWKGKQNAMSWSRWCGLLYIFKKPLSLLHREYENVSVFLSCIERVHFLSPFKRI